MRFAVVCVSCLGLMPFAVQAEIRLPCGDNVPTPGYGLGKLFFCDTLVEQIWETDATPPILRLRYLTSSIGPGEKEYDFAAVQTYLQSYCENDGIPIADEKFPTGDVTIIISYMKEYVEFGASAPDVPQYFEAFDRIDGQCVVSEF